MNRRKKPSEEAKSVLEGLTDIADKDAFDRTLRAYNVTSGSALDKELQDLRTCEMDQKRKKASRARRHDQVNVLALQVALWDTDVLTMEPLAARLKKVLAGEKGEKGLWSEFKATYPNYFNQVETCLRLLV